MLIFALHACIAFNNDIVCEWDLHLRFMHALYISVSLSVRADLCLYLSCMHALHLQHYHDQPQNMYARTRSETDLPVAAAVPIPVAVAVSPKEGSKDDDDSSVGDSSVHAYIPPCPSYFGYPEDTQWSIHCITCIRKKCYSKPGICSACDVLRIKWVRQFFLGNVSSPMLYCYNPP